MAIVVRLDKGQYLNGLINLFRGDNWSLIGKLVDVLPGGYSQDFNAVGIGATAFFPTDPTLNLSPTQAAQVVFTNPAAGEFQINLPASGSSGCLLTPNGTSIYMATSQQVTYQTYDSPLNIQDPTFQQF